MSESKIPTWLEATFFRRVIQLIEETNLEIEPINIWCKEALPEGSNFLSDVFRVFIDYKVPDVDTLKTTTLFVKIPLVSEPNNEFFHKNQIYEREIMVYNEILPKMYLLHPTKIAPRSYPAIQVKNSLVLEDLSQKGYKMLNRLNQVDFQHSYHFLSSLATFHAVSVVLHKREPELLENVGHHLLFNYSVFSEEQKDYLRKMTTGMISNFALALSEIGCERYARLVRETSASYWDYIVSILKPGKQLNVLCHGDCWVSNIMFKYVNEQIVGTKFVDFQAAFFSSFAVDILVFWWSSANEEVRENHREELFEVYRNTLNKTFKDLKCSETLTKEEFDSEMKRFAPFAINIISMTAPTCLADPDDFLDIKVCNVNDFTKTDESPVMKNMRSKYYKALLPKLMEQGEQFGMFNQV